MSQQDRTWSTDHITTTQNLEHRSHHNKIEPGAQIMSQQDRTWSTDHITTTWILSWTEDHGVDASSQEDKTPGELHHKIVLGVDITSLQDGT